MTSDPTPGTSPIDRRTLIAGAGLLLGTTAACSGPSQSPATTTPPASPPSSPPAPSPTTSAPPTPAPKPSIASQAGPDIVNGPRDRHEVALTFHGQGELSIAHDILGICKEAGALITVFAVGQWAQQEPSIIHDILAGGHEVGNHTWSHQQMKELSAATAKTEVAQCAKALTTAMGSPGWWFRPSGTEKSTPTIQAAASAAGYARCVSYDVDPEDYKDPGAPLVRSRTKSAVKPGSIVSLHLGHSGTVQALPGILDDLKAMSLAPVTLSHLLRD